MAGLDDNDDGGGAGGPAEKVSELVKRMLTIGVGAIFLTEESLRSLIKQYKIPKEMISGLLESADRAKSEFLKNFSDELLKHVTSRIDVRELLEEFLHKNEIDLSVKIKVSPKK